MKTYTYKLLPADSEGFYIGKFSARGKLLAVIGDQGDDGNSGPMFLHKEHAIREMKYLRKKR